MLGKLQEIRKMDMLKLSGKTWREPEARKIWLEQQKKIREEKKLLAEKEEHDRLVKEEAEKILRQEMLETGRSRALETSESRLQQLREEIEALERKKAGQTQEKIDEIEKKQEQAKEIEERTKKAQEEAEVEAVKMLEDRQKELEKMREDHLKELHELSVKKRQELLDYRHRLGLSTPPPVPKKDPPPEPVVRSRDPSRIYDDPAFWALTQQEQHYLETLTVENQWKHGFGPYEASKEEAEYLKAHPPKAETPPPAPRRAPFARRAMPGLWPLPSDVKDSVPSGSNDADEQLPPPEHNPDDMKDFWLVTTRGVAGYDVAEVIGELDGIAFGVMHNITPETTVAERQRILRRRYNERAHAQSDLIARCLEIGGNALICFEWMEPQRLSEDETQIGCKGIAVYITKRENVKPSEWAKAGDKPYAKAGQNALWGREPYQSKPRKDPYATLHRSNPFMDEEDDDSIADNDWQQRYNRVQRAQEPRRWPDGRNRQAYDGGTAYIDPQEALMRKLLGELGVRDTPAARAEASKWMQQPKNNWKTGGQQNSAGWQAYVERQAKHAEALDQERVEAEAEKLRFLQQQQAELAAAAAKSKPKGDERASGWVTLHELECDLTATVAQRAKGKLPPDTAATQEAPAQQSHGQAKDKKQSQNAKPPQVPKGLSHTKMPVEDPALHGGHFAMLTPKPVPAAATFWNPLEAMNSGKHASLFGQMPTQNTATIGNRWQQPAERRQLNELREMLRGSEMEGHLGGRSGHEGLYTSPYDSTLDAGRGARGGAGGWDDPSLWAYRTAPCNRSQPQSLQDPYGFY